MQADFNIYHYCSAKVYSPLCTLVQVQNIFLEGKKSINFLSNFLRQSIFYDAIEILTTDNEQ